MLDIPGLDKAMDSLVDLKETEYKGVTKNMYQRTTISRFSKKLKDEAIKNDSVYKNSLLDVFITRNKIQLIETSIKSLASTQQVLNQKVATYKYSKAICNRHIISFHEKFALGFACIILFFVCAPLGALIRKGGIGLPMVIAILLFFLA